MFKHRHRTFFFEINRGPVSLTVFLRISNSIEISFNSPLDFKILIQWSLHTFVPGTTAVLSCMCENLWRSDGGQRNHSKAKFPSNLNFVSDFKFVSETGPRPPIFYPKGSVNHMAMLRSNSDGFRVLKMLFHFQIVLNEICSLLMLVGIYWDISYCRAQ